MDGETWIPVAIGAWIAGTGLFMFLFHPVFVVPFRRRLKWLYRSLIGSGGLILVVSLPSWLGWGYLYLRGAPMRAEILNMREKPFADLDGGGLRGVATGVTYRFEAGVGGQPRQFQREGELPGRYQVRSGFVDVLYDPADPAHSRLTQEFRGPRTGMVASAVLLSLGGALLLLSRRYGKSSPPPAVSGVA